MIPRLHHRLAALCVAAGLAISTFSCQKVPLLAPSGSSISLTTAVTVVPLGGTVDIIAQVIEPAGTPPQRGTLVSFTTSLGTLQPTEAETDTAGRAIVRFLAGNGSGTAVITALSGGVSVGGNTLRLLVGTAAVGSVRVTANPTLLQANGGTSTITAQSLDVNGNPLVSAPVNFSTTAGTIDQSFATSDQNGLATTILRTSTTATVTATVGVQGGGSTAPTTTTTAPPTTTPPPTQTPTPAPPASSGQQQGSVIVNVSSAPGLVITPPTTPPGEGLPAAFTIAVTAAAANGSAVRDVTVDWGDGSTQSLGVVTGNAVVSHIFTVARTYQVVVRVTDTFGNVISQSTSVTVIPVATPTINITPSVPTTPSNPTTVSFTIQVTPPTGVNITKASIAYGDGGVDTLGGVNGTIVKTHPYTHTPGQSFNVTVAVEDTLGRTTTGTTTITIP